MKVRKNIEFIDFLPNQTELYSLMKSAKVFVQPSFREGFGIVVIEANACGIPVITSSHIDNAAKDLIVEGRNGYLFSSVTELAEKINVCLENKANDKTVYTEAVQQYDWESATNTVLEAYTI